MYKLEVRSVKTILGGSYPPLEPDELLNERVIPLALNRIGADHLPVRLGRLNVFRWFVEFSQLDLSKLSPAAILAKREEYGALQRHLWSAPHPYMPPAFDLEELKRDASRHLIEFVDRGHTQLGPFTVYILAWNAEVHGKRPPWSKTGVEGGERRAGRVKRMLREMGELLREFGASMLRCPRCTRVFVKPRANANYCSRSCQNAHYMENVRRAEKDRKESRISKKGGNAHGEKTR